MSAREESVFSIIDSWDTHGPCCAKCKTPYNCGNTGCRCHERGGTR